MGTAQSAVLESERHAYKGVFSALSGSSEELYEVVESRATGALGEEHAVRPPAGQRRRENQGRLRTVKEHRTS